MRTFHAKYATDLYSQTGEDGIIEECLRRLDIKRGRFVEFGAHDGKYCSNTRLLLDNGWTGKLIESSPQLFKDLLDNNLMNGTELYCGMVTPENVNSLVPKDIQVLSIDVDGNDYNIWQAYEGLPPIVIIEINSSIPSDREGPVSDLQHGTAYRPMVQLGISKGYFLVSHHGNCIFVRKEFRHLFPEVIGDGLENSEVYFSRAWLTN